MDPMNLRDGLNSVDALPLDDFDFDDFDFDDHDFDVSQEKVVDDMLSDDDDLLSDDLGVKMTGIGEVDEFEHAIETQKLDSSAPDDVDLYEAQQPLNATDHRVGESGDDSLNDEDRRVLERARDSDDRTLFGRLWKGDTRDCRNSKEAVGELCILLAEHTNMNAEQMDRLFRKSAMFALAPDWDALATHCDPREITIGTKYIQSAIARWKESSQIGFDVPRINVWDIPVSLNNSFKVPAFPVDCLPVWIREFVISSSRALQTPADLIAMLTLPVVAGALARKYEAVFCEGWCEPLNLFCVTALPVGERKSAAVRLVADHIHRFEAMINDSKRVSIDQNESKRNIQEKRQAYLEGQMGKCNDPAKRHQIQQELIKVLEERRTMPILRDCQLTCDDESPEHLAKLLADQSGRMVQISAEGTLFEIAKGRYSEKSNFDVYLKAHCGDLIRTGRIGREGELIHHPALSIATAVQPDVIQSLSSEARFSARGFLGRWLYAVPVSKVGQRDANPPPMDPIVKQIFDNNMTKLWQSGSTAVEYNPRRILFSAAATKLIREFQEWIEPQLVPGGVLSNLAGWPNKLAGACVRISAILHCCSQINKDGSPPLEADPVAESTVEKAVQLGRGYLLPHAKAAMGLMGVDPIRENARRVVEVLARWDRKIISRRDVHRECGRAFKKVTEIDPVLDLLDQFGYIRPATNAPAFIGRGHKSPNFEINPRIGPVDAAANGACFSGDADAI